MALRATSSGLTAAISSGRFSINSSARTAKTLNLARPMTRPARRLWPRRQSYGVRFANKHGPVRGPPRMSRARAWPPPPPPRRRHPPALAPRDQAKQEKPNRNRRRRSAPPRARVENDTGWLTRPLGQRFRSGRAAACPIAPSWRRRIETAGRGAALARARKRA